MNTLLVDHWLVLYSIKRNKLFLHVHQKTLPFDITYIAVQGSCGIIFLLMIKRGTSLSRKK